MSLIQSEILPLPDVGIHANPFPGIRNFEPDEAYLFFGREKQIDEISRVLVKTRFLALIGYSGSGKSSLIKAGIIPAIAKTNTTLGARASWKTIYFRPEDNPYQSFATALETASAENILFEPTEGNDITGLLRKAKNLREVYQHFNPSQEQNWLIVIDQFEEIFRFRQYTNEPEILADTQEFINLFLSALQDESLPVYLMFSMRSDFLDTCTEFQGLAEAINTGSYLLPRVSESSIRDIIIRPIQVGGGTISEKLVSHLLSEVDENQNQLPILQHALMRTWDYWRTHRLGSEPIDISHYEAIGTMASALSVHAEEVYKSFTNFRSQVITEKIFKALTDVTVDNKGTRRPLPLHELVKLADAPQQEVEDVIEEFRADGRAFLMPSVKISLTDETVIDIAHESIMRVWVRLKEWVQEETKSAELYLRLSKSSELFQQEKTGLWVNPDLALAINWQQKQNPNSAWAARYDASFDRAINFLESSKKDAELEIAKKENKQKQELKRTRTFLIILGMVSFISLLLFMYSYNEGIKVTASEHKAKENEKAATSSSKLAVQERKEALLQQQIAIQQQQITEEEKKISEEQKANALIQKAIALKQKGIAETQTDKAIIEKIKAKMAQVAAQRAEENAKVSALDAQRSAEIANKNEKIAIAERKNAETSEENAKRLRRLAVARTLSIESAKIYQTQTDDLPALLALQAFTLNTQNKGFENNPNIFNALSEIADDKPVLRNHKDAVRSIAVAGNGSVMASASDDGTVNIYNRQPNGTYKIGLPLKTGKVTNQEMRSLALSPDAKYLLAGAVDGRLLKWDLSQTKPEPEIIKAHQAVINKILFSATQNKFITISSDGFLKIWDQATTQIPVFSQNLQSSILAAALSENGNKIAVGLKNGSSVLYNLNNPADAPITYKTDTKPIQAIAFDQAGKLLVTGNAGGNLKIWDLANMNRRPIELIGHISGINAISFHPDNKTFATAGFDKSIRIWTLNNLTENPIIINKNDSWVMDATYSPDGKYLLSAGADKSIRIFKVNKEELAQTICTKIKRNLTGEEWANYIGNDIAYQKTCPDRP